MEKPGYMIISQRKFQGTHEICQEKKVHVLVNLEKYYIL